ncbi:MAG: Uma2 family endonuclease [Candidatus Eremiobacteraeota bacterium]|nr:Uma2 family endonuclease [Candidatus Eremiobacteraeota bacterium]
MLSLTDWLDRRPYKERFDGRFRQKMTPQRKHGITAGRIFSLLYEWGSDIGDTAVEWRVYLDDDTTLLPHVSFFRHERLAGLTEDERERPRLAPDIAVEIRSPKARQRSILRKTELYLWFGTTFVLNVDTDERTITVDDADGSRTLRVGETIGHPAFPSLAIAVADVFSPLERGKLRPQ